MDNHQLRESLFSAFIGLGYSYPGFMRFSCPHPWFMGALGRKPCQFLVEGSLHATEPRSPIPRLQAQLSFLNEPYTSPNHKPETDRASSASPCVSVQGLHCKSQLQLQPMTEI